MPQRIQRAAKARLVTLRGQSVIHFLHLPKTGGTAIKHALLPYQHRDKLIIELHEHSFLLRDVPRKQKVFFFVRDPISRFISGFYSRQRQGQPRYDARWTPAEASVFATYRTPNELALALSSPQADTRQSAMTAMQSIRLVNYSYWHWFENEQYLLRRSNDILFIGFQENLTADFEILKQILQLPEAVQLPQDDLQTHRNPIGLNMELAEEAVANLTDWFSRDYEFVEMCRKLSGPAIDAARKRY
jgi:hypothetical protein